MKTKSTAKAKTRSRSKTRANPKKSRTTRTTATPRPASITTPPLSPDFKTCEEVEVGDIGGVGITTEGRKERGDRCTPRATPPFKSWMRNLCNNHHHPLHKEHDKTLKQPSGHSPRQR